MVQGGNKYHTDEKFLQLVDRQYAHSKMGSSRNFFETPRLFFKYVQTRSFSFALFLSSSQNLWSNISSKHFEKLVNMKLSVQKLLYKTTLVNLENPQTFFLFRYTCSVNVQTWKLIFMFAFVSTLFSNTTDVIEIFLHSCDNLTLKILYDVLGLGQTPWWRLCWRSACRISCISAYHGSIQVFLWSWDVHDRHP